MSGHFSVAADNTTGIMRGQMTLAEVERACTRARAIGCSDESLVRTTNEMAMSQYGQPVVTLSFEVT